ncbi:MAG: SDR family NAD(P)-dependent oxidoreductase [Proteobacteria bacterium]|nr:SDR family NAD(P)-dependent oxidoreductase [Pseudomonadota bacterium]
MERRHKMEGQTAFVTGAAHGIGKAVGQALVEAGARVVFADCDEAGVQRAVEGGVNREIERARAEVLDVSKEEAFFELVNRVESEWGPIDVLVNNAAVMDIVRFDGADRERIRQQLEVNLGGTLNGMAAVLPQMVARGSGHVVNMGSIAGQTAIPYVATYAATKNAIAALTEAIRSELRGTGVALTCILPGQVETRLLAGAGSPRLIPRATVEQVATATLKAIRNKPARVYVPGSLRFAAALPYVLPQFAVDAIARFLRSDTMYRSPDPEERAPYDNASWWEPGRQ